jgi:hypothetical protein
MPFILLAGSFSTPSTAATTLPSIFSFHLTLHHEAASLYFFCARAHAMSLLK